MLIHPAPRLRALRFGRLPRQRLQGFAWTPGVAPSTRARVPRVRGCRLPSALRAGGRVARSERALGLLAVAQIFYFSGVSTRKVTASSRSSAGWRSPPRRSAAPPGSSTTC
ncbi:MAG: hypothetical protein R3F11_02565 [Verrucomicrobiales bacterium]